MGNLILHMLTENDDWIAEMEMSVSR